MSKPFANPVRVIWSFLVAIPVAIAIGIPITALSAAFYYFLQYGLGLSSELSWKCALFSFFVGISLLPYVGERFHLRRWDRARQTPRFGPPYSDATEETGAESLESRIRLIKIMNPRRKQRGVEEQKAG